MRRTTRIAAALTATMALALFGAPPVQAAAPAGDGRATPVIPHRGTSSSATAAAPANEGPYWLFNGNSGLCLTVQGASRADNARTLQFTCNETAPFNEDWFLVDNHDGTWEIVNSHSGKCLTVQGASQDNQAAVIQFTCSSDSAPFNEVWEFVKLSDHPADHWFHIVNRHSGKCLTINGASTANNAFAVQYTCDNRQAPYNEEWQLL